MESGFSSNFTNSKNFNSFYIMDTNNFSLLKNGVISKLKYILEENVKNYNLINSSNILVNDYKNTCNDNLMTNEIGILTDLNVKVKQTINKKSLLVDNNLVLDDIFNECMILKKNMNSINNKQY